MSFFAQRKIAIAALIGILVGALGMRSASQSGAKHVYSPGNRVPTPPLRTLQANHSGRELVMVIVGGYSCGASRGTLLGKKILGVRDSMRAMAKRDNYSFVSIGVALDEDPELGIMWLNELGGFDEVAAGHRWLNTAAVEYIWRTHGGFGVTPQVIILTRRIERSDGDLRPLDVKVLARMVGVSDIHNLAGLSAIDSLLRSSRSGKMSGQPESFQ